MSFVTIVLLLTAAGIIPESKQQAVGAIGTGDTLQHTGINKTLSNELQYTKANSVFMRTTDDKVVLATGRATLMSNEAHSVAPVLPATTKINQQRQRHRRAPKLQPLKQMVAADLQNSYQILFL